MTVRKTKIVCTIGPAVEDDAILRQLMLRGMNVARMNFSHGDHEEHQKRLDQFKMVRQELALPIALLLDTKGPEIRTGDFENGKIELLTNQSVTLVSSDQPGSDKLISVSYKTLYKDVSIGSKILIDDGLVELEVTNIDGQQVVCRVVNGGPVSNRKSINLPDTVTNLPALTDKDVEDIQFAIDNDFDFIAVSFVRKAADILEIRKILEKQKVNDIHLIAKIENREGVNNFDEILKVADGIMVARGDLGVEIPVEEVPSVQKSLIKKCYSVGKPCITATQMLDSMIRNPRPTRAEVSDVANAILDGTSAIMLSGETAAGKYPIESLVMMDNIARQTEKTIDFWERFNTAKYEMVTSVANAISHATCTTAMDLKAGAIVAVTISGRTARLISRFRPACPIIATTTCERSHRQLSMSWGVHPYLVDQVETTEDTFELGIEKAIESGAVSNGDIVVITGGSPIGVSGTTNILKVQTIGHLLAQGKANGQGVVCGEALVIKPGDEIDQMDIQGEFILVAQKTDNSLLPVMKKALAIIVEDPDPSGHTMTVGLALDKPVIYACDNAVNILKTGSIISLDLERGTVS